MYVQHGMHAWVQLFRNPHQQRGIFSLGHGRTDAASDGDLGLMLDSILIVAMKLCHKCLDTVVYAASRTRRHGYSIHVRAMTAGQMAVREMTQEVLKFRRNGR